MRVDNPMKDPTFFAGKGTFLSPFHYSCFENNLVDRTVFGVRSFH